MAPTKAEGAVKVFVICFCDYEGDYFISVWSSETLAEAECARLNAKEKGESLFGVEEVEVDKPHDVE